MSSEEDAILGLWPRVLWRVAGRVREEFLDAVDLAMQKRREAFVVGGDGMWLEVRSAQDGGAKEFAAGPDAGTGEWDDGGFSGGENCVEERRGLMIRRHGCCG